MYWQWFFFRAEFGRMSLRNRQPGKNSTNTPPSFMEGKKIGHGRSVRQVADGKVTTTETMVITIERLGKSMTVRQRETCVETTDGRPISFESVQNLGAMTMKIKGTVDGDGNVGVTTTMGKAFRKRLLAGPKGR